MLSCGPGLGCRRRTTSQPPQGLGVRCSGTTVRLSHAVGRRCSVALASPAPLQRSPVRALAQTLRPGRCLESATAHAASQRSPLPVPPVHQISIIDARKFEAEAAAGNPLDEVLERCELLENKQGQPLLAHGRSGSYTDSKRVLVPMIHGQALLPDLKITDSSEALLTGRAPPFRLAVRAVHRSGEPFEGVAFSLSEPFVVSARAALLRRVLLPWGAGAARRWGVRLGCLAGIVKSVAMSLARGREGLAGGVALTPRCRMECVWSAFGAAPRRCHLLTPVPPLGCCAGGDRASQGRSQAGNPARGRPRVQDRLCRPAGARPAGRVLAPHAARSTQRREGARPLAGQPAQGGGGPCWPAVGLRRCCPPRAVAVRCWELSTSKPALLGGAPAYSFQTQKKLEDIKAAAVAAGVPDLNLPVNSVVKGEGGAGRGIEGRQLTGATLLCRAVPGCVP